MAEVTATVLLDIYRWHDEHGNTDSPVNEANRGDTIKVSAAEFERSQTMRPVGLSKGESPDESEFASSPREVPKDLSELKSAELKKVAAGLGLDVANLKTDDALRGAIAAAPGYERPQV